MTDPAALPVDLTNCDREPIHILGAIQPFGFLVAVSADWRIVRASSNLGDFVGRAASEVLGKPLGEVFSADGVHDLRNMVAALRGEDAVERGFGFALLGDDALYDVALHFSGSLLIIEVEPAVTERGEASSLVRTMMQRVRQTQTMQQFLQEAARQVRAVTGFDRVMVYRFDQSGSGEVVAEARASHVDSFLGLNYPASDIPAQARALYVRNVFRIIADIAATPVQIVPQLDEDGAPLDLSMSVLRSVSPIHLEYLRNMGVGASLSISIVVEGRLWGLFACHHYSPRLPSFRGRTTAELFGSMFSLMLESRERAAIADYEGRARALTDRLMSVLAQDGTRMADAEWLGSIVADAIPSDGVGVRMNGVTVLTGLAPDEAQFEELVGLLNGAPAGQLFTTDHIASLIPDAAAYANRAAGLLAIPVSRSPGDYVVLFRSERLRSVRWAGNPEKPAEYGPNGARLTPRKSFEEWAELVKNRSVPFSDAELRVAGALRSALLEVILRMSDAAGEERRSAQERQGLLIAELNHRVRNILALIRGLLSQSKGSGSTPEEMLRTLDDRVLALARAHDQITADKWGPASLRTLVETETRAFLGGRRDRVALLGRDVALEPQAFTVVALVIHELVTNAAKYGALADSGTVQFDWRRDDAGDLHLAWREVGGPMVAAPTRSGFGSTIITRSIPHELGGRAEVRFRPMGLEADFVLPARFVVETGVAEPGKPAGTDDAQTVRPLATLNVLLLEDSLIVALDCESLLKELGAETVFVSESIEAAQEILADQRIDFAVLDLNLGRGTSVPVADALAAAGTPFVFATGYGEANVLPDRLADRKAISKPYTAKDLSQAAESVLAARS